ncbi:MAG TPA: cation:proton antiporter [Kofleriaceae bacterium]|jgi:CPA1 family monovalent cation:H+ antiporter
MAAVALLGVLCVVAINAIAPKLRISAPLLLVVAGVAISLQPFFDPPMVAVDPHVILSGVLPLLLFAAAVSMPSTNFRRNLGSIVGLSVSLVVLTALALGALFGHLLPELGLAGGIAIGAILSPTDAVATSIVKSLGVAPRVVALLDGEAMLNDASALVLLRSSIAATVTAVSIRSVAASFAFSILVASAIGITVGFAALYVRRLIAQPTVNTLLSFAVPFVAFQPAEHLGASGLVAVVAAGLVIGQGAPRFLQPLHRVSETVNWRTVEMLLEGGLFLLMGLQLLPLVRNVRDTDASIGFACMLAGIALAITLVVRALYAPLILWSAHRRQRRYDAARSRLEDMQSALVHTPEAKAALGKREASTMDRMQVRVRRVLADADYGAARPLGVRDGALLVWAGMRGAITLAAADTLPPEMPHRSLLVLVAFLVATASLLVQGGTLGWVIRHLRFPPPDDAAIERERIALTAEIERTALAILDDPELRRPDGEPYDSAMLARVRERLARSDATTSDDARLAALGPLINRLFDAQRATVLDARADGVYSTESLAAALARIDSLQLGIQLASSGGGAAD